MGEAVVLRQVRLRRDFPTLPRRVGIKSALDPWPELRTSEVLPLAVVGDRIELIELALYLLPANTWGNLRSI